MSSNEYNVQTMATKVTVIILCFYVKPGLQKVLKGTSFCLLCFCSTSRRGWARKKLERCAPRILAISVCAVETLQLAGLSALSLTFSTASSSLALSEALDKGGFRGVDRTAQSETVCHIPWLFQACTPGQLRSPRVGRRMYLEWTLKM